MRKQFYFGVSTFLVMVGVMLFAMCNSAINFGGDGKGTFTIIKTLQSPDGNHTATFWNGMGGGAAGWCRNHININDKNEVFNVNNVVENSNTAIFDVRCSSETEIIWKSKSELKISYSPKSNGRNLSANSVTKDGQVKISFEEK